jgi:methyl-accepting chemotaxis protein WspA
MLNKITHRLILGFSIPIITLIFLGGFIFSNTRRVEKLQQDVKSGYENQETAIKVAYATSRIIGSMRGYTLYPGDKTYRDSFEMAVKLFNEQKAKMGDFKDSTQQTFLKEMIDLGEEYIKIGEEIYVLIDAKKNRRSQTETINSSPGDFGGKARSG